jgi:hypothetical protein
MNFPERITVEVAAEDIKEGWHAHARRCPVAKAAARSVGQLEASVVPAIGTIEGNIWFSDADVYYVIPDEASVWISDYDDGNTVQPFSFVAVRKGTG